ncbi:uncharacterized protein [Linepithema humile]|uniref:uncharacterized protein isoform X3 n=1 Tax=Linepithema humile TaxID=83485 RepID=UPI00351E0E31
MDIDQFFQNSHYNISRILLSINGLWPFHTKIKRYVIYFALVLIIGSGFIFQVMGAIEVREDSFEIIDTLPFLLLGIVVICKMMFAVYMLPKIKLLLIKIQEYSLISKSNEEHKIHNLHAMFGRNLSYAYTYIVLGHSILFNVATLLTRLMRTKGEKNDTSSNEHTQVGVAYRVNYVIDFDKYYAIIFIHTTFCIVWYVFLPVTLDVLYITLIEHCRGMFAAVKYRLENALLLENDNYGSTKTSTRNKFYLNMVYSIRRHTETIQFLNLINSAYSPPLFMHMGGMMLGLGIVEYQVRKLLILARKYSNPRMYNIKKVFAKLRAI